MKLKYPNIEAERAKRSMTKASLCQELNITVKTYRSWQCGRFDISAKHLVKLAQLFECSADYLLGLKEER